MILSVGTTHLLMASEDSDVVGMKAIPQTPQGPRAMYGYITPIPQEDTPHRRLQESGGDRVYPKKCNYCIQLYSKLQKCVSHVYPNFFFICSPPLSVPQSFVPLQLFPRHDEAIIFEDASYSSRCKR